MVDQPTQTIPSSGVLTVFPQEAPPIAPPGMPGIAPIKSAVQQTVVIQPSNPSPKTVQNQGAIPLSQGPVVPMVKPVASNPFIPVIPSVGAKASSVPQPPVSPPARAVTTSPPPRRGNGLLRIIVIVFAVVMLLGGLVFAATTVMKLLGGGSGSGTITYWGLWENEDVMAELIADFESTHPNIKVEYLKQSHRQYRARLQAAIERGDGPDVFRFHNTWVSMLHPVLATVPKTVTTPTDFSTTFYPVASRDLVAGESIYGIPMMIDGLGLYYNLDYFASKGINGPPTTWGELMEMVPTLTEREGDAIRTSAIALGTTGNVENFSDIVALMLAQNGAKLSSPTGPEAEQALIFYHKFADPADALYTWNESLDNSIYAFAMGRVAMIMAPSWRAFDIRQMNPEMRFAIAPVPQLPDSNITWGSYWVEGVSAKSKNQKAAWEFVKYLTSEEAVTKLYTQAANSRLFGEPYARVTLASTVADDPYVGAFVSQAPYAVSFPLASRTFDEGINDKLIKYLEDAVNGITSGSSPNAVLETAAAGFAQVFQTYGLSTNTAPSR